MPGQFFSVEAFATEIVGPPRRDAGPPNLTLFNLAAAFGLTTIAVGAPGRVIFVELLVFSVQNTGAFRLADSTGIDVYASAAQEASVLGGVEHPFERMLWTTTPGAALQIASSTAGSLFSGRMIWRHV